MEKEVQIQIGMRWNHPSVEVICRETERFLGWLTDFEKTHPELTLPGGGEGIPVHWNIPSYPFLELRSRNLDDLVVEIKTRVQGKHDIPIPMGYSGGVHPLLTLPELERECAWGITNPWNSGIKDTFGKCPDIIIPWSPDVQRSGAITCYAENRFSSIGINSNSVRQLFFRYDPNSPPGTPRFCLFYPLTQQVIMQCKKDVRRILEENHYILPLFFDCMYIEELVKDPFNFEPFTDFLDSLLSKYTVRFTSFTTLPAFSPGSEFPSSFDPRDILPNHPLWRQKANQILEARALSIQTADQTRDILITMSPLAYSSSGKKQTTGNKLPDVKEESGPVIQEFPPEDRINTADMQGHVTLTGNLFSVRFVGGEIQNLLYRKKKILAGERARSYIRFNNMRYDFKSMSAFSITGDTCRGLREIRKIIIDEEDPPGSQLTDYIYVEDFPYLIVTSKITYPHFPADEYIEEYALFELPLFYMNGNKKEHVTVHMYTGESRETCTLPPEERSFSLTGNAFVFLKGSIPVIIGFPGDRGPELQILTVKITKHKKGFCFTANINGSYFPVLASPFSRATEIFSFFLGVCPSPDDELPLFPAQVLDEIPRNVVVAGSMNSTL